MSSSFTSARVRQAFSGSRLRALAGAGCALLAGIAAVPAMAQDNSPIPIGMVMSKQGVFADVGRDGARGAMMAIDDVGSKINGRPVKLIWYDDPDPQSAQQNTQKLIDNEKVVAIMGGTNSASSLAESSVAKNSKIPVVIMTGSATELTGKSCNRYTFRTYYSAGVAARALVPELIKKGKKWYFLAPNYAAGLDAYTGMKGQLDKMGGTEVGYDKLPVGTTDFSSFILKIRQANPDVVGFSFAGLDIDNFLKQWAQYGMKDKIPVGDPFLSESSLWALDKDSATGTYAKIWQYTDPSLSPAEKKFAAAYRAKYNLPASMVAWEGWMSMRAILDAISAGKSTAPASIVHQLETLQWHDTKIPSYYRAWDHQFIHPLLIVNARAPKASDKYDLLDIEKSVPESAADIEKIFGTQAEVGCHMDSL
ncbi:MAG: ABC transporter substrate-binding protein [Janthinobacterium lividum]